MKSRLIANMLAIVVCFLCTIQVQAGSLIDVDGDAIADGIDNCPFHANARQRDQDRDGFGDRCDADFNNDFIVDQADLQYLRQHFFEEGGLADLDGDGTVSYGDLALLKAAFGRAPAEATPPRAATLGDVSGTVSLLPTDQTASRGEQLELELWIDFTSDPTLGGGMDIHYDQTRLEYIDTTFESGLDPELLGYPDDLPGGELDALAFGEFDGLSGPMRVAILRFDTVGAGLTPLSMDDDSEGVAGPFVSAVHFGIQNVAFEGASIDTAAGPGAAISFDRHRIDFGEVDVGQSAQEVLNISNVGDTDLSIETVFPPSPAGAPFAIVDEHCSAALLAPSASCDVVLEYAPETIHFELDEALLEIHSNDPWLPRVIIALTGQSGPTGSVPDISVAQTADFGGVAVGGNATLDVVVSNTGSADLSITAVGLADALEPPFALLAETCTLQPLLPDEHCLLTIEFAPVAIGEVSDVLSITSNDPDEILTLLNLSGSGISPEPKILVEPVSADFGDVEIGQVGIFLIFVSNIGLEPLEVGQVAMVDPLAAPFNFSEDFCSGTILVQGANCYVHIDMTPDIEGDFSDTFDVPSNDPLTPTVTVTLSGSGFVPDVPVFVDVKPGNCENRVWLDQPTLFETAVLGTDAVDVSQIDIGSVTLEGACARQSRIEDAGRPGDCADVNGDGRDDLILSFQKWRLSARMNDPAQGIYILNITGRLQGEFGGLAIRGGDSATILRSTAASGATRGDGPVIRIQPPLLQFGVVPVGEISDRTIVVSNDGSGDLIIGDVAIADPLAEPFVLLADDCSATALATGATCELQVRFAPVGGSIPEDTFDIPSNDPATPSYTVFLNGFVNSPRTPVAVDIKAGRCPNHVYIDTPGTTSVVIAGSAELDVTEIDIASVRLAGLCASASRIEDLATPYLPFLGRVDPDDCHDLDGDGFDDLVVDFNKAALRQLLGDAVDGEVRTLKLHAEKFQSLGGESLIGEDVVVIERNPPAQAR